jgi:hypothetical protein
MAKGESGETACNVENEPTRNRKREKGEAGKDKSRRCIGNWTDAGEMEGNQVATGRRRNRNPWPAWSRTRSKRAFAGAPAHATTIQR